MGKEFHRPLPGQPGRVWVSPQARERPGGNKDGALLSGVHCPVLSSSLPPGGQSKWFGGKDPEHSALWDSGEKL